MKKILLALMALVTLSTLSACHKRTADVIASAPAAPVAGELPKAVIYRTSGAYNDNVPVILGAAGRLQSYPAPSDITADSTPLPLADGWLLDRRGITPGAAFTRWTYAQYAALPQVPSRAQLLESIIPGAVVTAYERLDMTPTQAAADTAAINAMIRRGDFNSSIITPTSTPAQ